MNNDGSVDSPETIILVDPHAGDRVREGIPTNTAYRILTIQELRASDLRFAQATTVAVTTIAMIDDVLQRLDPDDTRCAAVDVLRDKYAFRQLLSAIEPDLHFQRIHLRDLPELVVPQHMSYVVKPVRGAFATGVRTITATTDLVQLVVDIQRELQRLATRQF